MSVRGSLATLAAVMLAAPAIVFSSLSNSQAQTEAQIQRLQFYTVQRGRVEMTVSAVGTLQAQETVNLSAQGAGRVAEVYLQAGDHVLPGDALLRLEDTSQQLAYQQALLNVERAQIQMEDLLGPVNDEDVLIAQANLNAAWGRYLSIVNAISPEQIQAAELQYQAAQQALADADRIRYLAPDRQLGDAQYGAATFNAEIARLQLEQLQTGNQSQANAAYAAVIVAQRQLEQVQAGPVQAQIDQAQLRIDQAAEQVERARTALDEMTVYAPLEGIIASINTEVGALIAPGLPVAQIVDLSPLHLVVQIDEVDIGLVAEGMPARVELDALPEAAFEATLDQLSLVGSNLTGIVTYDARVTLNGADARLRVGLTAEANIVVQSVEDVLIVPNYYVRLDRRRDQAFVNVVQPDGTLREIEVTLGLRGQETSEIVGGLQEGDVIAVDLAGDTLLEFGG